MRLKYKKVILITTMTTMGIGLLTFSLDQSRSRAEENGVVPIQSTLGITNENKTAAVEKTALKKSTAEPTVSPMPTATPTPMPSPHPLHRITKKNNAEMLQLFKDYYTAKAARGIKKIQTLLSDPSNVESKSELQGKTSFIVDYKNIRVYVKEALYEGTYIAYVYNDIEILNISTRAPSLTKFYIVTGDDGKLKIFSGVMDEEVEKYYDARQSDKDVQYLIEVTNKKSKSAKAKDEDLKEFWDNIDALAKSVQTSKTEVAKDTEEKSISSASTDNAKDAGDSKTTDTSKNANATDTNTKADTKVKAASNK